MKQFSFSFNEDLLNKFKTYLPVNKSKKIFRNYFLNEYQLPKSLSNLQKEIKEPVIQPYCMTDAEIVKLDRLVQQAEKDGFTINRSAIMRDILNDLVLKYQHSPLEKSEQHTQRFQIPIGTKERLSLLIDERDLTYELSTFIIDHYNPSGEFPILREKEEFNFKTDIEIFKKLDDVALQYDFKKGGRSKVFRDALLQFETLLQAAPPKKKILKQELEYVIDKYKSIEDVETIREEIEKYLTD